MRECFNCGREGCLGPYQNTDPECWRLGFELSQRRAQAREAEQRARDEALRQEGALREREATVAYLRHRAVLYQRQHAGEVLDDEADALERSEHIKESP